MDMWLGRQIDLLNQSGNAVVLRAPRDFGAIRVARALAALETPVVWIELSPSEMNDEISLGNKLSDAINRCLEARLFGYGLSLTRLSAPPSGNFLN